MSDLLRLDVGCGARPKAGCIGIDRKLGGEASPLTLNDGTPVPDGSCDLIVCSHVLEHFPYAFVGRVVQDWVRALAPGGRLQVAVPNFEWIARRYLEGLESRRDPINAQGYVMGGQTDENDFHHCIFDREGLTSLFQSLGLEEIQPWEGDPQDCSGLAVSLNLTGVKPETVELPAVAVAPEPAAPLPSLLPPSPPIGSAVRAVMTLPRLCFTDNMFCAMQSLIPLQVHLETSGGVFWGQGLTRLLESHLHDGTKYLLTLDYDTLFCRTDVEQLYALMEANPQVDFLQAMQSKRDSGAPLFTVLDRAGRVQARIEREALAQDLLPVNSGHFGLTLLRVESLLRLPKPWFRHQPDAAGGWDEGRLDEDGWFWHQARLAGLHAYQANRIVIGHAQLMATWPDRDLVSVHQYLCDYQRRGKPDTAWS